MSYYKTNALYKALNSAGVPQFKFVVGDAWQLVYGDSKCTPLLLVFAKGVPAALLNSQLLNEDLEAVKLFRYCSEKANLPFAIIKFPIDSEEVTEIRFTTGKKFETISMKELTTRYNNYGLPISNTPTDKYLNDRYSSAYHNWQRKSLGKDLTVTDIDLWKLDSKGNPQIILELKRSFYSPEEWKPYLDDYNNFKIISNLCNEVGINFMITYNYRITKPKFKDDPSRIALFDVDFSKTPPINKRGIVTFEEFLEL